MGIVSCMQGRKLLMNSPRVYEKTLHFARADRAVRPYNVSRKIFCENVISAGAALTFYFNASCGVK